VKNSPRILRYWSVVVYFGVGFLLHLIWEHAQMPLYAGFPIEALGSRRAFMRCLYATATGDMLFMLTLYLTLAMVHENLVWPRDPATYSRPATWVVPAFIGSLLAVTFELWAVYVAGRWKYDSMPVIPVLRVGLTPLLQMVLIPIATIGACRWTVARCQRCGVPRSSTP
jgi:hypothetical protein